MKKNLHLTKLACICALSASLALIGIPLAFAADTEFTNNEAKSSVELKTNATQLKATIPTTIPLVAEPLGGAAQVPNNYQIVNGSSFEIYITKIAGAITTDTDWSLSATPLDKDAADPASKNVGSLFLSVDGKVVQSGDLGLTGDTAITVPSSATSGGVKLLPLVASTSVLKKHIETDTKMLDITYTIAAAKTVAP